MVALGAALGASAGAIPAWAVERRVTVDPASGLAVGQTVNVRFSGFPPEATLKVRQCNANPRTGDDCDFHGLETTDSNAAGAGALTFRVRALPDPAQPSAVTCDGGQGCLVVVSEDLNDLTTKAWAGAEMRFGGALDPAPAGPAEGPGQSGSSGGSARPLGLAAAVGGVCAVALAAGRRQGRRARGSMSGQRAGNT